MRTVEQPGPAPAQRIQWVEARGRPVTAILEPGRRLLDAVQTVFAAHGFASGVLRLTGGAFGPFAYVMPALSETPRYAAFYSATHRPPGASRIRAGALTFGLRDGAPFFHCHALWTESGGGPGGGHVLPAETFIAEPIPVSGIGLDGAVFAVEPDPETNFTLFGPVAQTSAGSTADRATVALRLRPNQDLSQALEVFCRDRGIAAARVHGGVGSIIGARYQGGGRVEAFATEMAILSGRIAPREGGEPQAELDVALVDHTGAVSEGRLVRGENPVLMTLEVVLEPCG
jgi:predicted DNA-binding protein with PD1-like motif